MMLFNSNATGEASETKFKEATATAKSQNKEDESSDSRGTKIIGEHCRCHQSSK